jgi:hypothetical protein
MVFVAAGRKPSGEFPASIHRTARAVPHSKCLTDFYLVLRQEKEFELVVVDLAKDPFAAGPLARSTPRNSNHCKAPDALHVRRALFVCLTRATGKSNSSKKLTRGRRNVDLQSQD